MAGVPEGNPKDDAKSSRRLLCLSGGGYRGLFTAIVLEHIEARLQSGEKWLLRDHFDLVAGTSIGGLLACGIAAGIAERRLREVLEEDGSTVFPERSWATVRQMIGPLYSGATLARIVRKALGGRRARRCSSSKCRCWCRRSAGSAAQSSPSSPRVSPGRARRRPRCWTSALQRRPRRPTFPPMRSMMTCLSTAA